MTVPASAAAGARGWRAGRALAPLRHRDFRLLTAGQLASTVGDGCYAVALPWYVLAGHGSALLLGTVLTAYGLPRTVLVGVAGHASDRWRPWTVMMAADAVRVLAVAGLAAAAWRGPADPGVLIPVAALLGAGEGLFLPPSFSILPALVPDGDLQAGNGLSAAGTQLASLVGPALGGSLVAFAHPAPAFAVDAATFLASVATLAGIRARRGPARTESPAPTAQEDGAATTVRRLLRTEPVLVVIFAVTLAANLGSGGLSEVALPALAHGPLRAGAGGYGALVAAIAVGGLVGTLAAGHPANLRRPAVVASAAFLGEAVFMAAIPYAGSTALAGLCLAAFGGLNGFGNVLTVTAFQRWAPPRLLGRLMSLILFASFGVFPVSVALAGVIVGSFGPAVFFPAAAAVLAVALVVGLSQPSWREFGAPAADAG